MVNSVAYINNGNMPKNLDSADKLFGKHSSEPFNPNLAQVFFKSGLIEAWGRGFDKIKGVTFFTCSLRKEQVREQVRGRIFSR